MRLEIDFMDGLCARGDWVRAVLTIASDERVKRVEEYMRPEELG